MINHIIGYIKKDISKKPIILMNMKDYYFIIKKNKLKYEITHTGIWISETYKKNLFAACVYTIYTCVHNEVYY